VKATCSEGDIRLMDGAGHYEGRVEVCNNNTWGTVCTRFWAPADGRVACHQLGLRYTSLDTTGRFGLGSGPIWAKHIFCDGTETRLYDCRHSELRDYGCGSRAAGVRCTGKYII